MMAANEGLMVGLSLKDYFLEHVESLLFLMIQNMFVTLKLVQSRKNYSQVWGI